MGWTQWWTATQTPPSLVAMVPEVAPPDQFRNLPYQEGVLFGCMMDWASSNAGRTTIVVGKGGYGGFSTTRFEDFMRTAVHRRGHQPQGEERPLVPHLDTREPVDGALLESHLLPEPGELREGQGALAGALRLVRRRLPRHADELRRHEAVRRHARGQAAATGHRPLGAHGPGKQAAAVRLRPDRRDRLGRIHLPLVRLPSEGHRKRRARRPAGARVRDGPQPMAGRKRLAAAGDEVDEVLPPQRRQGQLVGRRRHAEHNAAGQRAAGPVHATIPCTPRSRRSRARTSTAPSTLASSRPARICWSTPRRRWTRRSR